jgi:hypothetical protein
MKWVLAGIFVAGACALAFIAGTYWGERLRARLRNPEAARRFALAVLVSLTLHGLVVLLVPRKPSALAPGPMAQAPLNVRIEPAVVAPPQEAPPETKAQPVAPPVAPQRPAPPRRKPSPEAPAPKAVPVPAPVPAPPVREPPPIPAPPVDMMAAIEARRAQRRAAEAAAARGPPVPAQPTEDAAARNLATLSGREGVGGVFQILRIGTRTAEFAFNGWKPDARSQWREVIEVDAGLNGNVELAIIRRMIQLIRTHYTGDFHWESHRLGRVVTLSARPEDSEGLEDFMMREFFGQPLINPRKH